MNKADILIVEDEAIVAADLTAKLKRLGYEIAGIAAGGEKAVTLADDLKPQLILMDIRLEGPMDGIEAAELIRGRRDVPVIYLTAHSDAATLARAKLTGPFGYILKPFEERELAAQIELALYKHQADREIREQREWLHVTLSSIGDAVIATDAEGRITFINPVAESLTGWNSREASGQPVASVFQIVNEQTEEPLEEIVTRVLREGRAVGLVNHTALVTRADRTVPIEDSAAPIMDAEGQVIGAVLVFHDVTQKRRAVEALRESEGRLSAVLEQLPVGVGVLGRNGQIIQSNSALREVIPQSTLPSSDPERMERWHSVDNQGGPLPPHQWPGARALRGETVRPGIEFRYTEDDGRKRWLIASSAPFRSKDDEIIGAITVVEDITERKRMEEGLRNARDELEVRVQERTAELEKRAKQLAGLSLELTLAEQRERNRVAKLLHDHLQQLLVGAKINQELLMNEIGTASKSTAERVLDLITQSIQEMRSLNAQLAPPVLDSGDLSASLGWLVRWMHENQDFDVNVKTEAPIVLERKDLAVLVFQSIRELLFNVIKHAGVKTADVTMGYQDGNLQVVISDRGKGFHAERVWGRAESDQKFGLITIRERLLHLSGRFEIESAPDRGTAISLILPLDEGRPDEQGLRDLHTEPPVNAVSAPVPIQTSGKRIRVMLVDDHAVMREGLSRMLEPHADIEVVGEASDGEEAVHLAQELIPDAILMDISMPKMNGLEATRIIHAEFPHIRIIGLSMYDEDDQAEAMLDAGASAYRSKSSNTDRLLAAIRGKDQQSNHH
jgi:PAS domain S-box-containing protein